MGKKSAPLKKGTICSNSTPGARFWYPFFSEWTTKAFKGLLAWSRLLWQKLYWKGHLFLSCQFKCYQTCRANQETNWNAWVWKHSQKCAQLTFVTCAIFNILNSISIEEFCTYMYMYAVKWSSNNLRVFKWESAALRLGRPGALPAGLVQPCPKPRALIHKNIQLMGT